MILTCVYGYDEQVEQWWALTREIDVATCANTLEDARAGLRDAAELYLSYMRERGENPSRPIPDDVWHDAKGRAKVVETQQVEA